MQTENLKKHIAELEEKRLATFLHVQNVASTLNGRLYTYSICTGVASLCVLIAGAFLKDAQNAVLVSASQLCAAVAVVLTFLQYVSILDKNAHTLFDDISRIFASYNDEYTVLKKFRNGDIDETLIRQYYISKSKKYTSYSYGASMPNGITWTTTSLFLTAVVLLLFV